MYYNIFIILIYLTYYNYYWVHTLGIGICIYICIYLCIYIHTCVSFLVSLLVINSFTQTFLIGHYQNHNWIDYLLLYLSKRRFKHINPQTIKYYINLLWITTYFRNFSYIINNINWTMHFYLFLSLNNLILLIVFPLF